MSSDLSDDGQITSSVFPPFKSALQVTLTYASRRIHLNTAQEVAALGWAKTNKKSRSKSQGFILSILPEVICRTMLAIQVSGFPKHAILMYDL